MDNEIWTSALVKICETLSNHINNQSELDNCYKQFVGLILNEMDKFLTPVSDKKSKKCHKFYKPYWDKELSDSWKLLHDSRINFRRCKDGLRKTRLKCIVNLNQRCFDKLLKHKESVYNKGQIDNIEKLNTSNPKEFWSEIGKLRPKKSVSLPIAIEKEV